ncbi:SDR family NAD(P)-dependent oxidoreductase [Burkholderia multivorans]|uniref:SDR family NAD(P)-dependent oxidoreductase n=1 Tax=Burkholderia multivorans TaxID=87883 RepID=UPI0009BE8D4C|nr:SDR family NAD(P)-dependent oxidoreductase [Burkholderia multivorans]
MKKSTAVILGVGSIAGLGAALCRRIASEGYHIFAVGRSPHRLQRVVDAIITEGYSAEPVVADVTMEGDVIQLFDYVMTASPELAPPSLVIYNVGNNRRIPLLELSVDEFGSFWRAGPLGAFLVGREVARRIAPLGMGTLIFTGASASLRGKPDYAHFSASKAGVRMLSQWSCPCNSGHADTVRLMTPQHV